LKQKRRRKVLQIEYKNEKVKTQCTSVKAAKKLFGGDVALTKSLLSRVNALANAENLRDIIVQPTFRFHDLHGKLEGYFAIDVKTKKEPWRIILQPLDESMRPYNPCNIDEISGFVKIVEIMEVSKHYE
jgi:proteic killer suppression protein